MAITGSIVIHFAKQAIEQRIISSTNSVLVILSVFHRVILENNADTNRTEHITPSAAITERFRACDIDPSAPAFVDPVNEVNDKWAEAPPRIEGDLKEADDRIEGDRTDGDTKDEADPCLNDLLDLDRTPTRLLKKDAEAKACCNSNSVRNQLTVGALSHFNM